MKKREVKTALVTALLILAGILLTVLGILRGEAQTVLEKAIRICTECMGLG